MRPDVPGFILDATALRAAPGSVFVRTLISLYASRQRPIVVPATALVVAAGAGWIHAAELDPPAITVTVLTQAIAPAVALIISGSTHQIPPEVAHVAYEAVATGYPVLTTEPAAYADLAVSIDIEEVPE